MTALSKFLVLLVIFLLANLGDAFINLSSAAGNPVRVNHLIQLKQPMSDPMNEPSRKSIREPTKRMDLYVVLPNNLSPKKTRVVDSKQKQGAELPSKIASTQSRGLCHNKKSERVLLAARAKCLKPHKSSCASKVARAKCLNSHQSSCASKVAHAKCLNSRESSCASKVARAKCLNSHESSCASLLVAHAKCLNSNESSCASLLAVHAKPLKSNKTQRMTPCIPQVYWQFNLRGSTICFICLPSIRFIYCFNFHHRLPVDC